MVQLFEIDLNVQSTFPPCVKKLINHDAHALKILLKTLELDNKLNNYSNILIKHG